MTFDEIRKCHEPDKELHFRHPDIKGTLIFDQIGLLTFITDAGIIMPLPLYFSDFDRGDWMLAPIAED